MTLGKNNLNQNQNNISESSEIEVRENFNIPLWEEKLTIDRSQKKLGEVVVRKRVETRMIQIPVRQETLIVERVGEEPKELASIVISEDQVNGFTLENLTDTNTLHLTKSHYLSVENAIKLLASVARLPINQTKIRLEIASTSSEAQIEHQTLYDRFMTNSSAKTS